MGCTFQGSGGLPARAINGQSHLRLQDLPVFELAAAVAGEDHSIDSARAGQLHLDPLLTRTGRNPTVVVPVMTIVKVRHTVNGVARQQRRGTDDGVTAGKGKVRGGVRSVY